MERIDPLVRRAQRGEVAAFEQLYRQQVGRLNALCLRMTADPVWAEMLVQDAFVRAWERLDQYRGESAFSTWLHRLTVNVVLEAKRSEGRRSARVAMTTELDELDGFAGEQSMPGEAMDLEAAMASLPPGARTAFVLHAVEGYKHEEMAEMLGCAVGTCKAQVHRARKLLQKALSR